MQNHRRRWARVTYPALGVALAVGLTAPPAAAQDEDLPWMDTTLSADERANLLIDAMTLDQKIQQLGIIPLEESDVLEGCEFQETGRHIEGIPELSIPTVRMTNGGTGVKGGSCQPDPTATGLPATPAMAATFDHEANYTVGEILGEETYAFAHQVMLGPGLNLLRLPYAGRAFEYPSEDPYLAGVVGVEQVRGIQDQGIQAQPKHLAFNEQELERWTSVSVVESRAAHELYLLPFEMAVREGDAASAMCSFPVVNDDFACENADLLRTVMEDMWGFDGWIMSDRRATHSTVQSIEAGLDVELGQLPGEGWQPEWFTEELITMHIDAGDITESDIDEMLFDRYTKMFEFGQFENPFLEFGEVDLESNGREAYEIAAGGAVLLKNEGILPLDGDAEQVAIIGPEEVAGQAKLPPRSGNDLGETVVTPYTVSPQEGLERVIDDLGYDTEVVYDDARDLDQTVETAEDADVVLLMLGDLAMETQDKEDLLFPELSDVDQEALIDAVLEANPNTVVVLKTSGMMLMPWLDEAPAVLQAWYPGQEDGNVVADLLYGVVNPSGKLPVTFGNSEDEAAWETERQYPGVRIDTGRPGGPGPNGQPGMGQLHFFYDEGLEMGYRWYEANDVTPTFAFGHGLSYTTFEYSDLVVTPTTQPGRTAVDVTFTVTNTGDVAGAEAAQVYLTLPDEADEPSKRLVGFDKVHLEPDESATVTVTLDSDAASHTFEYWQPASDELEDWAQGEWVFPDGEFTVHVGTSSADTALERTLELELVEGPGDGEDGDIPIEATIPGGGPGGPGDGAPGSLVMTVHDFGGVVQMSEARRADDRWRLDGDTPVVTVTDTRTEAQAGDAGWTVSGQADDFTRQGEEDDDQDGEGTQDAFGAEHLGWIPWSGAENRPGVDAGPRVDGVLRGGPGLAEPQTLVSATSEGRQVSATAGAHLLLEVPMDTEPGDYRSTLSLSLFAVD